MRCRKIMKRKYAMNGVVEAENVLPRWKWISEHLLVGLFVRIVQVLIKDLSHGKHMHAILFEDCAHRIITSDLPSVARILEIVVTDILPEFLDCLRARELSRSMHYSPRKISKQPEKSYRHFTIKQSRESRRKIKWFL